MISRRELERLLSDFKAGKTGISDLLAKLNSAQYEELGFAKVDHGRKSRCGFPEVIFAQGKTPEQVIAIGRKIIEREGELLITRLDEKKFSTVKRSLKKLSYSVTGQVAYVRKTKPKPNSGILILTAGTSDIPIAEEAAVSCEALGYVPERFYDVGVAGLHRLVAGSEKLTSAKVVIVVAGMEGALPSVVGGLVDVPVVAVPTSVGYGSSFGGIAALLAMLNSCASGVTVVNIDNGYGAAAAALRIVASR